FIVRAIEFVHESSIALQKRGRPWPAALFSVGVASNRSPLLDNLFRFAHKLSERRDSGARIVLTSFWAIYSLFSIPGITHS
ncbi:hypothetical protein KC887_04245, partial [Candidatus Kaiserbacteria bacterium]|nr:hypothetical protein [Candidatus Kaiserbacteria bacterium]